VCTHTVLRGCTALCTNSCACELDEYSEYRGALACAVAEVISGFMLSVINCDTAINMYDHLRSALRKQADEDASLCPGK
jgi:hypothetical protein